MIKEKLPDGSWRELEKFSIMWKYDHEKEAYYLRHGYMSQNAKEPVKRENKLWLTADSKEELLNLAVTLMRIATGDIDKEWEEWKEWRKNAENERSQRDLHEERSSEACQHEDCRAQSRGQEDHSGHAG